MKKILPLVISFIMFSLLYLPSLCESYEFGSTVDVDLNGSDCTITFLGVTDWNGVAASGYVNGSGEHGVAFYTDNWIYASLPEEDRSCGSLRILKEHCLSTYSEDDWNAFQNNIYVFFGSYEEGDLYCSCASCNVESGSGSIVGISPELEEKLHDIDLAIEEFRLGFAGIEEDKVYEDFQNKEISEKLDILISLVSLGKSKFDEYFSLFVNDNNENYLESIDSELKRVNDYNKDLIAYLYGGYPGEGDVLDLTGTLDYKISNLADQIDKSLTATNEKTLEELNQTMLTTNSFLSRLYVIFLVILVLIIAGFVGWIVHRLINHNLY